MYRYRKSVRIEDKMSTMYLDTQLNASKIFHHLSLQLPTNMHNTVGTFILPWCHEKKSNFENTYIKSSIFMVTNIDYSEKIPVASTKPECHKGRDHQYICHCCPNLLSNYFCRPFFCWALLLVSRHLCIVSTCFWFRCCFARIWKFVKISTTCKSEIQQNFTYYHWQWVLNQTNRL